MAADTGGERRRAGESSPAVGEFEAWYREQWPRLVRVLTAYCGDLQLARDLAAEAFVRALERWDTPRRPQSPTVWTSTVAFNLLKAKRRRKGLEDRFLRREQAAARSYVPREGDMDLWEAVSSLPPRTRKAVLLRYVADLTEAEVAEVMGVSAGTVATTLSRARKQIAERLSIPDPPDTPDLVVREARRLITPEAEWPVWSTPATT